MTPEQAIAKLVAGTQILQPDYFVRDALLAGEHYGYREFSNFRDQRPGEQLPEWKMGEFSGTYPRNLPEELQDAYETVLDCAARDEWNRLQTVDFRKLDEWLTPPAKTDK